MPATLPPIPELPEVTVPLSRFVPPSYRHYFTGLPECPNYKKRRFDFWGSPDMLPLARAFLDTCAADRSPEYRYRFTLLGHELAANAIAHSRSGQPGGTYTLLAERFPTGMRLTCRDEGHPEEPIRRAPGPRRHLAPDPAGWDPDSETGRGLLLIDALATSWGDNGMPAYRKVWFYLADEPDPRPTA